MKFSVCVDSVFFGKDVYESIELLAENGMKNIEFWAWWNKDIDRLLALKEKWGLTYTTFCTKDYCMVDPKEQEDYIQGFEDSCKVAVKLGCSRLISKTLDKTDAPWQDQYDLMKETLIRCMKIAEKYGVVLMLEPINSAYEAPNTFMDHSALAFRFVDEIKNTYLKTLYDIYHMQIDEGNVLKRIVENIDKIAHIHTAGSWERHELKDGELNYDYIFTKIAQTDYDGYIGLEYFPAEDPVTGLLEVINQYPEN